MNEREHPVDDAVRRMAEQIEPSIAERQNAEDRLRAAIETEQHGQPHGRRSLHGRWLWAAAAAATLVGLFFGVQLVRPSATEAAMEEIAETVEALDPVDVPEQEFLKTDTVVTSLVEIPADMLTPGFEGDTLAYLLPTRRQTWYGDDNTVQLRTTNQTPVFFTEGDEHAYYAAGIDDLDMIGETTTDIFTDPRDFDQWPTEPDALDETIRRQISPDSGQSEDAQYLEIALGFIREVFTPPELRAATLTLIGRIPTLEVVDESDSQTTFAIDYEQNDVAVRHTFTVTSNGELGSEEIRLLEPDVRLAFPTDTSIFTAEYSTPVMVDTLDQP